MVQGRLPKHFPLFPPKKYGSSGVAFVEVAIVALTAIFVVAAAVEVSRRQGEKRQLETTVETLAKQERALLSYAALRQIKDQVISRSKDVFDQTITSDQVQPQLYMQYDAAQNRM